MYWAVVAQSRGSLHFGGTLLSTGVMMVKGENGTHAVHDKAKIDPVESRSLKEEDTVISKWYILDTDGNLTPVDGFDFSRYASLKKFADYEIKKVRAYQQAPPHIALMKQLQLVDYEPGSDPGNLRYYPNGKLIKNLLERYVGQRVNEYGGMEVETPIMYDYKHPSLAEYLHRFPSRHYVVRSDDKEFFLRFAACFGQFLMAKDATVSYKQLPFRIYELARYSFRREKSGEVVGLKRLRAFVMPDMHTICTDLKQAKTEFGKQFRFCQSVLAGIGIGLDSYEAAFRFTDEFWEKNADFVKDLVSDYLKKPALVERWNFRYAYFDPKFEFNVIDSMDKATALSTVQVDHENGKRYGILYTAEDGSRRNPTILHCSPSGAIERVIYSLLEFAAIRQKHGETPSLPYWLSPTQIRLLPISDKYVETVSKIAAKISKYGIRADVDDTPDTLNRKIRRAEHEWVPYMAIVGEKEADSGTLTVRERGVKEQKTLDVNDVIEELSARIGDMPRMPLPLPALLSKRPTFVG